MSSSVIHLAIAKKIKNTLNIENDLDYYLGTVAPDLAKHLGKTKKEAHFLYDTEKNVPNISMYTNKYKDFKNNSFELGYFVHLLTDKYWFSEFMKNIVLDETHIKLLNGKVLERTKKEIQGIIYIDYTNINIPIIKEYNLDLLKLYNCHMPKTSIDEIPTDKLNILLDEIKNIIDNSKENKTYTFDLQSINEFINSSSTKILEELKKY